MDLGAYVQIGDLQAVADANGISIHRLRGYRLMVEQEPYSVEELQDGIECARNVAYERVVSSVPPFILNPECYCFRERMEKKYLIKDAYGHTIGIRWDKIHGRKRKAVKYEVRKYIRNQKTQMGMWNRYAGRDDVLYIHARLGSWSWSEIKWPDYRKEPWFLDGCDDTFDQSYCDIYAHIDPETVKTAADSYVAEEQQTD